MTALSPARTELDRTLNEVALGAAGRDVNTDGAFPEAAVTALERQGVFARAASKSAPSYREELRLLRRVAAADAGVARILDGHLNAIERIRLFAPADVREHDLFAIATRKLRTGVWGADPAAGEGEPACLRDGTITGVKTYCSGAGGLQRALILVRDDPGGSPALLAYVDLTVAGTVRIDSDWYQGAGMRSSASHRVEFAKAPVIAIFGEPGSITTQPWFARDAIRTAATWVGALDCAVDDALEQLSQRSPVTDLEALAAGRLLTCRQAASLWLDWAGTSLTEDSPHAAQVAIQARSAIAQAARTVLDEAERAIGSRALVKGSAFDRAGRDLRVFLLQHRLEPMLMRSGRAALEGS